MDEVQKSNVPFSLKILPFCDFFKIPSLKADRPSHAKIFNLLKPKCKYIIIEEDYVDYDHVGSFSGFYSKCFQQVDEMCQRLHFFRESKCTSGIYNNFEALNCKWASLIRELKNDDYLGFMVLLIRTQSS